MQVTANMVKELRERTQAGMADCKNALVEASGDMEKAVEVILKKGLVKAAKTAGKVASEGEVRTLIAADGKRGTIVEVNSQTDFVARGDDFKNFVGQVLEVASKLDKGADLGAAKMADGKTVEDARQAIAGKIGENIVVRRWDTVSVSGNGVVHAYVHMGGKNASIVALDVHSDEAAKHDGVRAFLENVAMQIVAMRPIVVDKLHVAQEQIAKQKEIFEHQLKEEGKPEASWPKILEGKLSKWFTEVTLHGQENVWGAGADTIDKIRQELGKSVGGDVSIKEFVRFELGEGIAKKTENLADEVAKTIGA